MKWIAAFLVIFPGFVFSETPAPPDAEHTRIEFEKMAADLPYLPVQAVIYNRDEDLFRVADPNLGDVRVRIARHVMDGNYSKEALLGLLKHENSRVRALALVALYASNDPSVLPALAEKCGDEAPTFDGYPELSQEWLRGTGIGPPPLHQTVADFARQMVEFYMEQSGYNRSIRNNDSDFAPYWAARKDRKYCAGWFAVQLARASGGITPTRKERIDQIQAVRHRIDAIPADDRAWVLLWLNGEGGSDALATEEDLVAACKKLGPEKLLRMLQDKIPTDDPDLQSRNNNNWFYKRMQLFVLAHAAQLFRPADADALLACDQSERNHRKRGTTDPLITSWWAIAAAELNPKSASAALHAAMQRFQDKYKDTERSDIAVALWRLRGKEESKYLIDWYYSETPDKWWTTPSCRVKFIRALQSDPNGKSMVAAIIRDPRFSTIDWQAESQLVETVNSWCKAPIVTNDEFQKAWHPLGSSYDREIADAEKKYPEQTKALRALLEDWRKRLLASLQEWE